MHYRLPLLLLIVCLLVPAVQAGQVVLFSDGRSLEVEGVKYQGEIAVLLLEGGNQISTPAIRIDRVQEIGGSEAEASPEGAVVQDDGGWRIEAGAYADLIADAAQRHGLDPVLLTAMATVESSFDPSAISPKGASGLLQLMPATARRFGVSDIFDVSQNVDGGARYLSWLLERYDGQTELALAGYNAGEGAVDRHQGVPPFRETREYVRRVLNGADRLTALTP
jgi:hypothetical protein